MKKRPRRPHEKASSGPRVPIIEALGQSEAFLDFKEQLSRVAKVDRPVLLIGERGTGKELAVSKLHYLSLRWQGPLVALNCAALSPTLIESELFGHEQGAFTGATQQRKGRFQTANEGTLFLDEIANIPIEVQEKILRVVEYGTFEQVGSSEPIQADVRIIGATNADLPGMTAEGLFKRDLLDRLSFEVLFLPPLRERKGDILLLANLFAAKMAFVLGRKAVPEFSHDAIIALEQYSWPGNVRELKNVVERAVYRSDSAIVTDIVFNPFRSSFREGLEKKAEKSEAPVSSGKARPLDVHMHKPLPEAVQDLEIRLLKIALQQTRFNQRKAARALGLTYHQFRGLYRKHKGQLEHE